MRLLLGAGAVLLATSGLLPEGCVSVGRKAAPSPSAASTEPSPYRDAPPPPSLDPGVLNRVTSLAVDGDVVHVGTDAGIVRLDASTGSYRLLATAGGTSLARTTALCLGPDGALWSAHGLHEDPGEGERAEDVAEVGRPRGGGLRRILPGGEVQAWFAEDGLGSDDVLGVSVTHRVVAAVTEQTVAVMSLGEDAAPTTFERRLGEPSRKLTVIDLSPDGAPPRTVIEFRPREERMLSVSAWEDVVHVGSTHALYRLRGEETARIVLPCRAHERFAGLCVALAHDAVGTLHASLGADVGDGAWVAGGLAEVGLDGEVRCLAVGLDVPDSAALGVAVGGDVTYLATNEGLTRLEGDRSELVDSARGAPPWPATAACAVGERAAWAGTWGGGVYRIEGQTLLTHRFANAPQGSTFRDVVRLR